FYRFQLDANGLRLASRDRRWHVGRIMGDVVMLRHFRIDLVEPAAEAAAAMRHVRRMLVSGALALLRHGLATDRAGKRQTGGAGKQAAAADDWSGWRFVFRVSHWFISSNNKARRRPA